MPIHCRLERKCRKSRTEKNKTTMIKKKVSEHLSNARNRLKTRRQKQTDKRFIHIVYCRLQSIVYLGACQRAIESCEERK